MFPKPYDWRLDTREFTIPAGVGMEFKSELDRGATMLYPWKASRQAIEIKERADALN